MGNVVEIKKYRNERKRQWLRQYSAQLDSFILEFIKRNIEHDFELINSLYMGSLTQDMQNSWDYHDLREIIQDALDELLTDRIYRELKEQDWFEPSCLNPDQILEKVLSAYITHTG